MLSNKIVTVAYRLLALLGNLQDFLEKKMENLFLCLWKAVTAACIQNHNNSKNYHLHCCFCSNVKLVIITEKAQKEKNLTGIEKIFFTEGQMVNSPWAYL